MKPRPVVMRSNILANQQKPSPVRIASEDQAALLLVRLLMGLRSASKAVDFVVEVNDLIRVRRTRHVYPPQPPNPPIPLLFSFFIFVVLARPAPLLPPQDESIVSEDEPISLPR